MKKKINILCFILILFLLILSGCKSKNPGGEDGNNPVFPPVKDVIEVTSLDSEVVIKDLEVMEYDFRSLFQITVNGKSIKVEESYINKKDLKNEAGTYNVICMYKGSSASINVIVSETIYEVNLKVEEVEIDLEDINNYDFKSLFTCLIDGKTIEITDDMVETDLQREIGTYSYTVKNGKTSKSLTVKVVENFNVDIMLTFKEIQIEQNKLSDFDFTTLFTIYENGKYVPVTSQMIDKSSLESALPNNTYPVTLNYKVEGKTFTKACNIKVVEDSKYTVTTKNVVSYPNCEIIDLKSLFEVKKGNQIFPITNDMITGNIDYSKVGNNEITLMFDGNTYKANVEIKLGVIINYNTSDTITILRGTSKDKYPFINDFEVLINGIRFKTISNKYIDTTNVDFNNLGTYEVTIKLPYNDNRLGLSGVKFEYIEKTIKYVVVNNDYKITTIKDEILLGKDDKKFDPFDNVNVVINGKNQTLTDNIEYVDSITCYAKVISEDIKFDYVGKQTIKMEVYVNGVDALPEIVEYSVYVESDIKITPHDTTMYTNDDLNLKELFTIKNGNNLIPVTFDMLTGKFDPTTPGAYTINIEYMGIMESAKVVVFDKNIKGTYTTPLKTFKPKTGMGTGEDEEEEIFKGVRLGNFEVLEDGSMTLQGQKVELVEGISEKELIIKSRSNKFKLFYDNGVIVLKPINEVKLSFNNSLRPMIYFNTNIWNVNNLITVNFGNNYVLEADYVSYSIDIFNITRLSDNSKYNVGMKVHLYSRQNSDSEYEITCGEVKYTDKFNNMPGSINVFTLSNESYKFILKNQNVGKIVIDKVEPLFKNKIFKGKIDGYDAELRSDNNESFELVYNNKKVFDVGPYELNQLLNGGCDYENNIIFIYDAAKHEYSYKFKVDPVLNTFELLERDKYFGYYTLDNLSVFLDGYGTGEINFDTNSFYRTKFKYTVIGNTIDIVYVDTLANFKYGKTARFTIDSFLNVLTIKDFYNTKLIDKKLIISNITNGAIVNIKSFQVGQGADKIAKAEFFNNIDIITKDGLLNNTEKQKVIDTKKIRFSTPGFYEFSISVLVDGETYVNYYGVEILEAIYEGNKVIGTYGNGIVDNNISLAFDMYGRVILTVGQVNYNGTIYINSDYSFVVNAESVEGFIITGTGNLVSDGLIRITVTGDANFTDYFTLGNFYESGIDNFIIRRFNYQDKDTYLLFDGKSSIGKIVSLELINGSSINDVNSIIKVVSKNEDWVVKILSWEDKKQGLVKADKYRNTYTNETSELIVDGFGEAILDGVKGTYKINNKNLITFITNDNVLVFNLIVETRKFIKKDMVFDNTLLENKTFTADHTFFCGDAPYIATTKFTFLENGVVNVISVSPDHDSGDNQCTEDTYKPPYASEVGVKGTFKVTLNKVEVKVNNETFVFEITDVISPNMIKCLETSLNKNVHGYFEVGQIFNLK